MTDSTQYTDEEILVISRFDIDHTGCANAKCRSARAKLAFASDSLIKARAVKKRQEQQVREQQTTIKELIKRLENVPEKGLAENENTDDRIKELEREVERLDG